MREFFKKSWVNLILILLAIILITASFLIPDEIKKGIGIEGDYFHIAEEQDDNTLHINIKKNDKGYFLTWETIGNEENYNYNQRTYQLNEELNNLEDLGYSSFYFDIVCFNDGMVFNYVYYEKEGVSITDYRLLKYILRTIGFGILTINFILAFLKKNSLSTKVALVLQLAFLLMSLVMFFGYKNYAGHYRMVLGSSQYDFYIENIYKSDYRVLVVNEETVYDDISDFFTSPEEIESYKEVYYIYGNAKLQKKVLVLDDQIVSGLAIKKNTDGARIVEKNGKYNYEYEKNDEVTRIKMTEMNSARQRTIITLIIIAVITTIEVLFSLIMYAKRKKVMDLLPYIPYGSYVLGNMVFTAEGYEDFANYALKNITGSKLKFREKEFEISSVNYEEVQYKKDVAVNIPKEFDKTWGKSRVTRVTAGDNMWFILSYKQQMGIVTTINKEPLMLLEMEACNEE